MNIQFRPVALAICALLGLSSHAVQAASDTQDRVGLVLNLPFDGSGIKFADAVLSLAYQKGRVTSGGSLTGWQVGIGSRLSQFSPVFSVAGLAGERCTYGSVGVSYGDGKWGLPVFIHGAHVQLGLSNVGGLGGFQVGVSSFSCFKRYTPPAAVAPGAASTSGSSGSSGASGASGTSGSSGNSGSAAPAERFVGVAALSPTFDWA